MPSTSLARPRCRDLVFVLTALLLGLALQASASESAPPDERPSLDPGAATALPTTEPSSAAAVDAPVHLASHHEQGANPCNPCGGKNPCNPCSDKNPCGANPCNPCGGKNPCGGNPCNPCAGKNPCGGNPCNPCAGRNPCGGNPCNPCAGKNPCGGAAIDPERFKKPAGLDFEAPQTPERLAQGEALWKDRSLGSSGLACATCHQDGYAQMRASFAEPYPHRVAMPAEQAGVAEVDAAEMVNFCMIVPMQDEPLAWDSTELAALTAYVEHIQKDFDPSAAGAPSANPCNPCGGMNPCNPCAGKNPCGMNPCNPCAGKNPCSP